MKKLDKYIILKYLTTFFFCLLLMTAIIVVIDISEKADDFSQSKLPFIRIFTDYYLGFIPRIDAMLFPLFVFISVIFFASKMAGRSEVIAILSSGVSYRRYLLPFFIGSLILAAILWAGHQYVVPVANKKWAFFQAKYIDKNFGNSGDDNTKGNYKQKIYFKVDSNSYAGIRGYDTISKMGNIFFIDKFKDNKLIYSLRAESFYWDTVQKKWKLTNVIERTIDSLTEKVTHSFFIFKNFNFKPRDLQKNEYLKDQMQTKELNEFIHLEKQRGSQGINSLLVERYSRDAIPFSVIILTLIGTILASKKVRGGSGMHLALGVILSFIYILFSKLTFVFATKGSFSPLLAAWIPNIIFTLLAYYLYRKAPK